MAQKLTNSQRAVLLKELGSIIVHKKNELVVTMNKSGISNVTIKTPNKILSDRVLDGVRKNQVFRRNFAGLITDIDLKKMMLSADGSEQIDAKTSVEYGSKIMNALNGLGDLLSTGKKSYEEAKDTLHTEIEKLEEKIEEEKKIEASKVRNNTLKTTSVSVMTLSVVAMIALGVYAINKLGK